MSLKAVPLIDFFDRPIAPHETTFPLAAADSWVEWTGTASFPASDIVSALGP